MSPCANPPWLDFEADEPCDPRELGPATAPGLSRQAQAAKRRRLVRQYLHADYTTGEIALELGIHPDSVSRIRREMGAAGGAA